MDIQILRAFFGWCTVLNLGLMIYIYLMVTIAGDFVYWTQSKFFPISRETFDTVVYCWIALYKSVWFVFNLVPWIALKIIAKNY